MARALVDQHKHQHVHIWEKGSKKKKKVVLPPKACFITKFMMMAFKFPLFSLMSDVTFKCEEKRDVQI